MQATPQSAEVWACFCYLSGDRACETRSESASGFESTMAAKSRNAPALDRLTMLVQRRCRFARATLALEAGGTVLRRLIRVVLDNHGLEVDAVGRGRERAVRRLGIGCAR